MGTDIHLYVEHHVNGVWKSADKWTKDKYAEEGDNSLTVAYDDQFYTGRNYDLFAMLADVRNGNGFAGIDTGDGFVVIAKPKGLPDDMSPELTTYLKERVDHTPSWLTLQELFDYDWTQTTTKRGWVSAIEWAQWRDDGKPNGWSGGISGGTVKHITPELMEAAWQRLRIAAGYPEERYASAHLRMIHGGNPDLDRFHTIVGNAYCQVSWQVTYYEQASEFFGIVIPRLLRLGKPEHVRIVFFFDS